jgi:hypothetical protein
MGVEVDAKACCSVMQFAQFDMKVDLRMKDVDMAHGRGEYGQHGVNIFAFFSPQRQPAAGVVMAKIVQARQRLAA